MEAEGPETWLRRDRKVEGHAPPNPCRCQVVISTRELVAMQQGGVGWHAHDHAEECRPGVEWKQPGTKEPMLWASIHRKFQNRQS